MIKYAVFEENNYRGISPESFFSIFLELDNSNQHPLTPQNQHFHEQNPKYRIL